MVSLVATLNGLGVDTLIITGCTTSGCIRATAVDTVQHGFRPICVRECIGDRAEGPHEANLFDINAKYGDVISKDHAMDYLNNLLIKAIEKILTVWGNRSCGFYDMRFIFELMYKSCIIEQNINNLNSTAKHFYRFFYNNIKNCIVYNDRQTTLINIEKSSNLTSLKKKFNYYKHDDYKNKPYIKLVSF